MDHFTITPFYGDVSIQFLPKANKGRQEVTYLRVPKPTLKALNRTIHIGDTVHHDYRVVLGNASSTQKEIGTKKAIKSLESSQAEKAKMGKGKNAVEGVCWRWG
jgi:hypothetical protein